MAVTSINIVRVSNNLKTLSLLDSLRRNTLNLFMEQNRLATGNKFNAPSEDPIGAAKALQLTEVLERQEQVLANISHADSFLAATDVGIGEINDLLMDAYGIASEMVNTTADQSQRDSMAELVRGIMDQMVTVGNRMYGGVYLFGGQQHTQPPFTQSTGGVEYRGDVFTLNAHVDYQQDPAINLTGAELFGALSTQVQGYVDWDPAVTAETRLADLNGAAGAGVNRGMIRINTSSPARQFLVDLSGADTVGNVVDMINAAAANAQVPVGAGGFQAAIDPAGGGITLTAGEGTVAVAEVGEGVTARDLGINSPPAATIAGGDLDPRVTPTTRIAALFGGAGAPLGSVQIVNGPASKTIDLSDAANVQDILNKFNGAGVDVYAQINQAGTGIDIVSRISGAVLSIGEDGGNTAERLGIRSFYGGTRLDQLNDGQGVTTREDMADFRMVTRDGSQVDVNLDGAKTIDDVLQAINQAAGAAGVDVQASLAVSGNGIRFTDNTAGAGDLRIESLNSSSAAEDLGIIKSAAGGAGELIGDDVNGIRTRSVFTALQDLHDALVSNGTGKQQEQAITRAAEQIKSFMTQTTRLQGMVGARSQAMNTRLQMTEDAVVSSQALLSEIKDLDYTEAVTRFQQAQTALQGNLMTGPRMLQLSLLDFLQ